MGFFAMQVTRIQQLIFIAIAICDIVAAPFATLQPKGLY